MRAKHLTHLSCQHALRHTACVFEAKPAAMGGTLVAVYASTNLKRSSWLRSLFLKSPRRNTRNLRLTPSGSCSFLGFPTERLYFQPAIWVLGRVRPMTSRFGYRARKHIERSRAAQIAVI